MADGLLYRATAEIESGDPIVINGNCKRTTLDEIISVIETDSDLIAPTEDGAISSDDYVVGDEIVRSGILYNVISAIAVGDAFVIGNNIDIAGSLTSQIQTLTDQVAFKTQDNGRVSQTSIDPNDITVTSLYNVTNNANMPDLGWWFVFTLVHSTNSSYITQFALKMADDWHEMCVREKNSGVWNSWQSIATRGVYRTQTKEVTITANASGWSYASVTWATPFIYTPHVSVAVSGAGMIPEPVAITVLNLTGVQVGMYAKNHDLKVMITATGWVKE
jgi:hypothetical protein